MSYSEEFIKCVGTVAGEAGGCSVTTWKVVAHCIKNRIGFGEWVDHSCVNDVLKQNFDAATDQNRPFRKAVSEMRSGKISEHTQRIIDAVYPIYEGIEEDITNGVVFYFSPKAQAAFHESNSKKYTTRVPDFAKSPLTEEVQIKGTEQDDMCWYRYKGTSRFFVRFVNESAQALVKAKVSIGYRKTKVVPAYSNLLTDNQGRIKSFLVQDGWGARFTVDGQKVYDNKGKEVMLIADGENSSAVIVVANGIGGIKSKTSTHIQEPNSTSTVSTTPMVVQAEVKPDVQEKAESKNGKDVTFNIKIVDSDNRVIPNFSYFLKYKGNSKKHSVGNDGIEKNIVAALGESISVEISGNDSKQVLKTFTVSESVREQVIKIDLYSFEILFRHKESKEAISHLNLVQIYRGQTKAKITNSAGKILVKAMPGFELTYKLRDGRNLITIKVDKNKTLRTIDINKGVIEASAKNLKTQPQIESIQKTTSQENKTPASVKKSEPKHTDQTSKRDQKQTTSQAGHPKTVVNDNNDDIEFKVLTYDKNTDQLIDGVSYTLEYNGSAKSHVSGVHGTGTKKHKGEKGKQVKLFLFGGKDPQANITLTTNNQVIKVCTEKPKLEYSGEQWYSRFMPSKSLYDLEEPFGTNIRAFIQCLTDAGISVTINTTHRPDARAYLMYYATMIKRGRINPNNVPSWEGVNIDWTHGGNIEKAKQAAIAMHAKYGIGNNPIAVPGRSNHNPKKAKAVDMKIINIAGKTVNFKGKSKKVNTLGDLASVGEAFNVFWFGSGDKPHWSVNGR